ncbi:hypothetical protein DPMN_110511 [Dreissena polymorpha]|uniref:Endonuclease/exonuclease/phosphatase domain-containing protein n=1 Tax=Dreissena polymorpha TaxID=45954 RepID=A0A9D4QN42_DREPO|nr:hypothetical protein DPMN_110511 [Dreissena polymorpha]
MVVAGDFNRTNIDWKNLPVRNNVQDKEAQQALLDLSAEFNLTQVDDEPTRENTLLDLKFTTNISLVKSTSNATGISDNDIVVADSDIKPF